jgi:hypothetical protein
MFQTICPDQPTAEAHVRSGAILCEVSGELVGTRAGNAVYASGFRYQYHSISVTTDVT